MCDPVTIGLSLLGGLAAKKVLTPNVPSAPAPIAAPAAPDPAMERATAEASATQAANAQVAEAKRAKQLNALAMGGDTASTLGGTQTKATTSVLGGGASVSAY